MTKSQDLDDIFTHLTTADMRALMTSFSEAGELDLHGFVSVLLDCLEDYISDVDLDKPDGKGASTSTEQDSTLVKETDASSKKDEHIHAAFMMTASRLKNKVTRMKTSRLELQNRRELAFATQTVEIFRQMDVAGEGVVRWDQFAAYLMEQSDQREQTSNSSSSASLTEYHPVPIDNLYETSAQITRGADRQKGRQLGEKSDGTGGASSQSRSGIHQMLMLPGRMRRMAVLEAGSDCVRIALTPVQRRQGPRVVAGLRHHTSFQAHTVQAMAFVDTYDALITASLDSVPPASGGPPRAWLSVWDLSGYNSGLAEAAAALSGDGDQRPGGNTTPPCLVRVPTPGPQTVLLYSTRMEHLFTAGTTSDPLYAWHLSTTSRGIPLPEEATTDVDEGTEGGHGVGANEQLHMNKSYSAHLHRSGRIVAMLEVRSENTLITGSSDGTFCVWDYVRRCIVRHVSAHEHGVNSLSSCEEHGLIISTPSFFITEPLTLDVVVWPLTIGDDASTITTQQERPLCRLQGHTSPLVNALVVYERTFSASAASADSSSSGTPRSRSGSDDNAGGHKVLKPMSMDTDHILSADTSFVFRVWAVAPVRAGGAKYSTAKVKGKGKGGGSSHDVGNWQCLQIFQAAMPTMTRHPRLNTFAIMKPVVAPLTDGRIMHQPQCIIAGGSGMQLLTLGQRLVTEPLIWARYNSTFDTIMTATSKVISTWDAERGVRVHLCEPELKPPHLLPIRSVGGAVSTVGEDNCAPGDKAEEGSFGGQGISELSICVLDGRQRKLIVGDSAGLLAVVDHVDGRCSKALDPHVQPRVEKKVQPQEQQQPALPAPLMSNSSFLLSSPLSSSPQPRSTVELARQQWEQDQLAETMRKKERWQAAEIELKSLKTKLANSIPPLAGIDAEPGAKQLRGAAAFASDTASGVDDTGAAEEAASRKRAEQQAQNNQLRPKVVALSYCEGDHSVVSASANGVVHVCDDGSKHATGGYHVPAASATMPPPFSSAAASAQSVLLRSISIGDKPRWLAGHKVKSSLVRAGQQGKTGANGEGALDHAELQHCALSYHLNMLVTVTNRPATRELFVNTWDFEMGRLSGTLVLPVPEPEADEILEVIESDDDDAVGSSPIKANPPQGRRCSVGVFKKYQAARTKLKMLTMNKTYQKNAAQSAKQQALTAKQRARGKVLLRLPPPDPAAGAAARPPLTPASAKTEAILTAVAATRDIDKEKNNKTYKGLTDRLPLRYDDEITIPCFVAPLPVVLCGTTSGSVCVWQVHQAAEGSGKGVLLHGYCAKLILTFTKSLHQQSIERSERRRLWRQEQDRYMKVTNTGKYEKLLKMSEAECLQLKVATFASKAKARVQYPDLKEYKEAYKQQQLEEKQQKKQREQQEREKKEEQSSKTFLTGLNDAVKEGKQRLEEENEEEDAENAYAMPSAPVVCIDGSYGTYQLPVGTAYEERGEKKVPVVPPEASTSTAEANAAAQTEATEKKTNKHNKQRKENKKNLPKETVIPTSTGLILVTGTDSGVVTVWFVPEAQLESRSLGPTATARKRQYYGHRRARTQVGWEKLRMNQSMALDKFEDVEVAAGATDATLRAVHPIAQWYAYGSRLSSVSVSSIQLVTACKPPTILTAGVDGYAKVWTLNGKLLGVLDMFDPMQTHQHTDSPVLWRFPVDRAAKQVSDRREALNILSNVKKQREKLKKHAQVEAAETGAGEKAGTGSAAGVRVDGARRGRKQSQIQIAEAEAEKQKTDEALRIRSHIQKHKHYQPALYLQSRLEMLARESAMAEAAAHRKQQKELRSLYSFSHQLPPQDTFAFEANNVPETLTDSFMEDINGSSVNSMTPTTARGIDSSTMDIGETSSDSRRGWMWESEPLSETLRGLQRHEKEQELYAKQQQRRLAASRSEPGLGQPVRRSELSFRERGRTAPLQGKRRPPPGAGGMKSHAKSPFIWPPVASASPIGFVPRVEQQQQQQEEEEEMQKGEQQLGMHPSTSFAHTHTANDKFGVQPNWGVGSLPVRTQQYLKIGTRQFGQRTIDHRRKQVLQQRKEQLAAQYDNNDDNSASGTMFETLRVGGSGAGCESLPVLNAHGLAAAASDRLSTSMATRVGIDMDATMSMTMDSMSTSIGSMTFGDGTPTARPRTTGSRSNTSDSDGTTTSSSSLRRSNVSTRDDRLERERTYKAQARGVRNGTRRRVASGNKQLAQARSGMLRSDA